MLQALEEALNLHTPSSSQQPPGQSNFADAANNLKKQELLTQIAVLKEQVGSQVDPLCLIITFLAPREAGGVQDSALQSILVYRWREIRWASLDLKSNGWTKYCELETKPDHLPFSSFFFVQVKIFEEDFRKERSDRERMNEEKEDLRRQVERLQGQITNLTNQASGITSSDIVVLSVL